MNERSFIVKSIDKTDSNAGISPWCPQRIGRNSSSEFQTRSGLVGKGLSFKPRVVLAPLRGIRDFVRLCRQRRRHPIWLLDKLQDRQDRAQTQERVNRRFHDVSALFL
jgi:hypothetical protein